MAKRHPSFNRQHLSVCTVLQVMSFLCCTSASLVPWFLESHLEHHCNHNHLQDRRRLPSLFIMMTTMTMLSASVFSCLLICLMRRSHGWSRRAVVIISWMSSSSTTSCILHDDVCMRASMHVNAISYECFATLDCLVFANEKTFCLHDVSVAYVVLLRRGKLLFV